MKTRLALFILFISINTYADIGEDAVEADNKLNENYKLIYKSLDKYSQKTLKITQLSWIDYRDKVCQFESSSLNKNKSNEWLSSSIGEINRLSCIVRRSTLRAQELDVYYEILNKKVSVDALNDISSKIISQPAALHVVGAYEGSYPDGKRHSYGVHPFGRIDINLKRNPKSKSIVLVLISYEPVNWHIENNENVKIEKIILGGYHNSKVIGIQGVPILRESRDDLGYIYKRSELPKIENQLKQLTGLDISSFQANYKASSFEIF